MNFRNSPPPLFDMNNLDEDQEIRIQYDRRGNPVRIWKERRWEGCFLWLVGFALMALGVFALYLRYGQ